MYYIQLGYRHSLLALRRFGCGVAGLFAGWLLVLRLRRGLLV